MESFDFPVYNRSAQSSIKSLSDKAQLRDKELYEGLLDIVQSIQTIKQLSDVYRSTKYTAKIIGSFENSTFHSLDVLEPLREKYDCDHYDFTISGNGFGLFKVKEVWAYIEISKTENNVLVEIEVDKYKDYFSIPPYIEDLPF